MVERSLVSFVVVMAAMAYVTRPWHVLALRPVQGLFAGYGSLSVAMAAESAPRDEMPQAIGLVQTAQRIGPALGPVIGGILAGLVGLRRRVSRHGGLLRGRSRRRPRDVRRRHVEPISGRTVARTPRCHRPRHLSERAGVPEFHLMMVVIFGLQFVDRSFGPVLPLYVEQVGTSPANVPLVSGAAVFGDGLHGRARSPLLRDG